jgi:GTP-binding protein HflX
MEELTLAVQQLLTGKLTTFDLTLPYDAGQFKNTLYELGVIEEESYDDTGRECLTIRLPSDRLRQLLGQANLKPIDVLPLAQATLLMPVLEEFEKVDDVEEPTMTEAEEKAFDEFDALHSEAADAEK